MFFAEYENSSEFADDFDNNLIDNNLIDIFIDFINKNSTNSSLNSLKLKLTKSANKNLLNLFDFLLKLTNSDYSPTECLKNCLFCKINKTHQNAFLNLNSQILLNLKISQNYELFPIKFNKMEFAYKNTIEILNLFDFLHKNELFEYLWNKIVDFYHLEITNLLKNKQFTEFCKTNFTHSDCLAFYFNLKEIYVYFSINNDFIINWFYPFVNNWIVNVGLFY